MKKHVLGLCLALPVLAAFAGCDNSDTPTAPNGGKKVEMKDVPAEKPTGTSKTGVGQGFAP